MEKFFKLKESGTNVSTEIMAGLTTFFAMSYIIVVNPSILSASRHGMGSRILGYDHSVYYWYAGYGSGSQCALMRRRPGMGLNAFFVYTVCFGLGFTWQQALSMVFICGILNIIITVDQST